VARPETLPAALEGARAVLLLCGHHVEQLRLERAGLAAAVRAGVSRVVYMSAAGAAGDPVPPLAADHRRIEDELAAIPDLDWAVLRPTAAYPSLLGGLRRLIGPDGTVPLAFGEARVNLVDARDVGAAAAVLLREDAGRFGQVGAKRVFTRRGHARSPAPSWSPPSRRRPAGGSSTVTSPRTHWLSCSALRGPRR
jgi:uncharacterized protein YbjT (DUF2867 family)